MRNGIGSLKRLAFDAARGVGLDLKLERDSRFKIRGLSARWDDGEPNITRGLIAEHSIGGTIVRFFVRDEADFIQKCHVQGRWYEADDLEQLKRFYSGGTFVDIGANVGNHTLYAALVLDAPRVVSFEPNPPAFAICRYNVLLNDLSDRVVLRDFGLASAPSMANVARSPEHNLGATQLSHADGGTLRLVRGDDALADEAPALIKIDVEALELDVIEGIRGTLARHRPAVFVEVDPHNRARFLEMLDGLDYAVAAELANSNFVILPR
jgi:FkbM family methyltransferase